MQYSSKEGNLFAALAYRKSGLNVVRLRTDGSKRPFGTWTEYIENLPPQFLIGRWFSSKGRPFGIAILCGSTSGNLEVMDFDFECETIFPKWCHHVAEIIAKLPVVQTPKNGRHVFYRCPEISGSQKLAMTEGDQQTLIETRGHGAIVVGCGSPPQCHPLNRQYAVVKGDLLNIPTITPEERHRLIEAAKSFNRSLPEQKTEPQANVKPSKTKTSQPTSFLDDEMFGMKTIRPGDDFNANAKWVDILVPHGWTWDHNKGDVDYWTRPGKDAGVSASTNHDGHDLLFVFSSNVSGFDINTGYSKFIAYSILNHDGDRHTAASCLSREGYGSRLPEIDHVFFEDSYHYGETSLSD